MKAMLVLVFLMLATSMAWGDGGCPNSVPICLKLKQPLTITNTSSNDSFTVNDEAGDTTPFVIDADGNVGIGTGSPAQELDLVGDLQLEDTTSDDTGVIYKNGKRFIHNFSHPTGDTAVPDGGNIFIGEEAGNFTMGSTATQTYHGSYNAGIGYQSLYSNTTGYHNAANGHRSLFSNTTGYHNTANGHRSLFSNTTGHYNTANGYRSLYSNTTGSLNIANGYQSLFSNTTGGVNTANGYQSLFSNTTGYGNIANGYQSGDNITTADFCIMIGYNIDAPSATADYQLNIGNLIFGTGIDGTGTTVSSGNIGIGVVAPDEILEVNGNIYLQDNDKSLYGTGKDAEIYFDATNLIIDPNVVSSGKVYIGVTGNDTVNAGAYEVAGVAGLSATFTFGGGGTGDIATMTFTSGILTAVTTVP